jgi:23S rRNA-/tRNA-specific pseudouridylate synthase
MEILFENDDMLAINKPAGLIVHSDGKTKELEGGAGSLLNATGHRRPLGVGRGNVP